MNINYLMEYLSRQLHTYVQIFSLNGTCLYKVCKRMDIDNLTDQTIFKSLLKTASPFFPVISTNPDAVAYATVFANQKLYVIGPVRLVSGSMCRNYYSDKSVAPSRPLSLYQCSISDLLNESLLLHNLFSNYPSSLEKAIQSNCLDRTIGYEIQKNFVDIIFHNQENTSMHNPYDQEIREVTSIRNGNPETLKNSWGEDYIGHLGILAKTPLRNNQNLAIVLVTLASRAAIEGGVMPEIAYSLSDSYINKIEEASNAEGALQLGRQAELQYTLLVKEIKETKSIEKKSPATKSTVSRCKDYICTHLHEKISTKDIAHALFMNANYLSALFRRSEGMTISEYILLEKIKLVKNMLIYSHYSYSQIASYLGFCSQSYLGEKFKKITGITLNQFREQYGKKEFNTKNIQKL